MSGLYYLGIIEGAMHARGEEAYPVRVWHALKMLAEILKAPEILAAASTPLSSDIKERILGIKEDLLLANPEKPFEPPPEKKRKPWSPEARARASAAASERMKALNRKNSKAGWGDQDKVKQFIENNGVTVIPQPKIIT